MDCLRCKEEMIKAKLKGDAVGTVVYLTNKKNGIFENEKNSTVSCYVCPKCGYVELNAANAKILIRPFPLETFSNTEKIKESTKLAKL